MWLIFILMILTPASAQDIYIAVYNEAGFTKPVDLVFNDQLGLVVVEQDGKVWTLNGEKELLLDISSSIVTGSEMGLLGIEFHPQFASNGRFYLDFTRDNPRRTVIAEFTYDNGVDTSSEQVLLEVSQPYSNHNAGDLEFGPDGMLYVTMGDGGSGGDPLGHGQNAETLLGSILRINVTEPEAYSIPSDNPFVGHPSYREEIYAYGLRNPWKISFDPIHNYLIVADVGQNAIEEVNTVESGKNYGWNTMEGDQCFVENCDPSGLELPFTQYSHTVGTSVTGGYTITNPTSVMYGQYIFGDFSTGKIFSFDMDNLEGDYIELVDTNYLISTFGQTPSGDIIFADYAQGREGAGKIYILETGTTSVTHTTQESPQTTSPGQTTTGNSTSTVLSTNAEANSPRIMLIAILPITYRRKCSEK